MKKFKRTLLLVILAGIQAMTFEIAAENGAEENRVPAAELLPLKAVGTRILNSGMNRCDCAG